jgi:cobalt-zinc-cadmium efflux system protein
VGYVGELHRHSAGARSGSLGIDPAAGRKRLFLGLCLIAGFMVAEATAGLLAHSLALLSDAAHMVTDAGALVVSLIALRLADRPPAGGLTYGLKRAEILSALANGVTLFVLATAIVFEAIQRLLQPTEVGGKVMLVVALAGVAVNLLVTRQLSGVQRHSLNIRGSYLHVLTDIYAFLATAGAAVIIITTGFARADQIASLFVAVLMVRAGYELVRDATRVLLEAAPRGMSAAEVASTLAAHPLVVNIHDFHLWEITSGFPALSAHVLVRAGEDCHAVRRQLERDLEQRFGISHTTLQLDHPSPAEASHLLQVGGSKRIRQTRP